MGEWIRCMLLEGGIQAALVVAVDPADWINIKGASNILKSLGPGVHVVSAPCHFFFFLCKLLSTCMTAPTVVMTGPGYYCLCSPSFGEGVSLSVCLSFSLSLLSVSLSVSLSLCSLILYRFLALKKEHSSFLFAHSVSQRVDVSLPCVPAVH